MGRYGDLARVHVLPRRARPAPRVLGGERPDARLRRALERASDPVRAARPERVADRGGAALPRRRRARHQAAPARAEVRRRRRAARAGLRARRRASGADPDPRRPRPAADRRRPARARRPLPGGDADHRARRHRRPRRARRLHLAGRKGVLFDTSTWSPVDLLDFYRQVPPEQMVYASDYPYGQQPSSLLIALKTARLAGYDDDQLRAMLGGTANALADGRRCPSRPRRSGEELLSQPLQLARIHQYLSMATPLLWMRQPDTVGVLGPRDQRVRRAERSRGGRRRDPRAARRGARPLGDAARDRGRGRPARSDAARRFD